ncbi:MAG: protein kinase [Sandaracinaceae bacterium]
MSAAQSHPARPVRQILEAGMSIAGRYVVLRVLGQGGMGQVLEVEHASLGRRFALKVLRLERWNDELVRRFNREARALAKLTTPRVAQVTDFGIDEESGPFYVMELLEGETLEDRLGRDERLPPREALTIGAALCDALADCHAAGIVHRDLKPSNVGLPDSGIVLVKLLDFGLAASMDDAFLSKITQSQQILGSLPYMAPEQFNAAPPSTAMDIYAVGICLYETITGRLPFMAPSTAALIHQILATPMPPLPAELPGAPLINEVLERFLAKEPERRFASMTAAATALREVLNAIGGPLPARIGGTLPSGAPERTRPGKDEVFGPLPATQEARAPGARIDLMATMMAESGTRLSSHDVPPTIEEVSPAAGRPQAVLQPTSQRPPPHAPGPHALGPHAQSQVGLPARNAPVAPWHSEVIPPTPAAGVRPFGAPAPTLPEAALAPPSPASWPGSPSVGPPSAPEPAEPSPWLFRIAVAALLGLIAAGILTITLMMVLSGPDDSDTPPPPSVHEPGPSVVPEETPDPSAGTTSEADVEAASESGLPPAEVHAPPTHPSTDDAPEPVPVGPRNPTGGRGSSGRSARGSESLEPVVRPLPPSQGTGTQSSGGSSGSPPLWNGNGPISEF